MRMSAFGWLRPVMKGSHRPIATVQHLAKIDQE